ncbi:DUF7715 family protein [Amycolatopsis lurida]
MKLLVATSVTQGSRGNDFSYCVDGELVWVGLVCSEDQADPDGGCGCGRAFSGMNSHRAGTTAMVVERPGFTEADYTEAIRSSLDQQGFPADIAGELAASLLRLAAHYPAGTVVERRLDDIFPRAVVPY